MVIFPRFAYAVLPSPRGWPGGDSADPVGCWCGGKAPGKGRIGLLMSLQVKMEEVVVVVVACKSGGPHQDLTTMRHNNIVVARGCHQVVAIYLQACRQSLPAMRRIPRLNKNVRPEGDGGSKSGVRARLRRHAEGLTSE